LQKCKALEALNSIFQSDDKKAYERAQQWEKKIKALSQSLYETVKNLQNEQNKEINSIENKYSDLDKDFISFRHGITNELSVRDVLQSKFKD